MFLKTFSNISCVCAARNNVATDGQHHRTQCYCHNVPSICWGLKVMPCDAILSHNIRDSTTFVTILGLECTVPYMQDLGQSTSRYGSPAREITYIQGNSMLCINRWLCGVHHPNRVIRPQGLRLQRYLHWVGRHQEVEACVPGEARAHGKPRWRAIQVLLSDGVPSPEKLNTGLSLFQCLYHNNQTSTIGDLRESSSIWKGTS